MSRNVEPSHVEYLEMSSCSLSKGFNHRLTQEPRFHAAKLYFKLLETPFWRFVDPINIAA